MLQFNRKYKLQIGDSQSGGGITIDALRVQFKVRKSSNNADKIDKASITIYNMSDKSLTYLESAYPLAILSCGYEGNLTRLFYGQITKVETRKRGTERVTSLDITPAFTDLTHKLISELIPENGTVEQAIEAIRRNTGLAKGSYKGSGLQSKIVYGYPLNGTPRQMLNDICNVYNLEWNITDESLHINSPATVQSEVKDLAPVISASTGLIEAPYYFSGSDTQSTSDKDKTSGVKFKALINPSVVPGTIIKLDHKDVQRFYRVQEVEFTGDTRGQSWYMDCLCADRILEA